MRGKKSDMGSIYEMYVYNMKGDNKYMLYAGYI